MAWTDANVTLLCPKTGKVLKHPDIRILSINRKNVRFSDMRPDMKKRPRLILSSPELNFIQISDQSSFQQFLVLWIKTVPLILKTGIFWKEIFLSFLVRHAKLGVVPQLGQLRVDLLLVRTWCNVWTTQLILGLNKSLGLLGVWVFHPTVRIGDLLIREI